MEIKTSKSVLRPLHETAIRGTVSIGILLRFIKVFQLCDLAQQGPRGGGRAVGAGDWPCCSRD